MYVHNIFNYSKQESKVSPYQTDFLYLFFFFNRLFWEVGYSRYSGKLFFVTYICLCCSIYLIIFNFFSVHLVFFSFVMTYCGKKGEKKVLSFFLYNFDRILLNGHGPAIPKFQEQEKQLFYS